MDRQEETYREMNSNDSFYMGGDGFTGCMGCLVPAIGLLVFIGLMELIF